MSRPPSRFVTAGLVALLAALSAGVYVQLVFGFRAQRQRFDAAERRLPNLTQTAGQVGRSLTEYWFFLAPLVVAGLVWVAVQRHRPGGSRRAGWLAGLVVVALLAANLAAVLAESVLPGRVLP